MTETHTQKYDRLIAKMGGLPVVIERLKVRISRARVRECLAAGDIHLNRIALAVWDRLALGEPVEPLGPCPTCKQNRPRPLWPGPDWPYAELRATAKDWPIDHDPAYEDAPRSLLSLAERVCILKRAAVRWAELPDAPDPED
jgi:hypothetical protein